VRARQVIAGAALALAAGALAACGGNAGGPTRAEFIARGDALCAQARKNTPRPPATRDPARLAGYLDAVDRVSTATLARFGKLEAPHDLSGLAKRFLASANARLADVRRARNAARRGDAAGLRAALAQQDRDAVRYRALARQIGFKICGSGG
jgi:hypothetical protein